MEDFHRAGGMPVLVRELAPLLHLNASTITGRTLGEELDALPSSFPQLIVHPLKDPLFPSSALVVLRGNLAPSGAVLEQSAATPSLLKHTGSVVVFSSPHDMARRIDSGELDVTPDSMLVLQNVGPVGNPGMPVAGLIPIPKKLAARGIRDMDSISDGHVSRTAQDTVVLHVAPVGGSLVVVRDGDLVELDVEARKIELRVAHNEIDRRLEE